MRKTFFLTLLAVFTFVGEIYAQSDDLVATLDHEDSVFVFRGENAFINAYARAVDGDVITLSPGSFYVASIGNKGISVYGAGITSSRRTTFFRDRYNTTTMIGIHLSSKNSHPLYVEGIYFDNSVIFTDTINSISNASFYKCYYKSLVFYGDKRDRKETLFVNCIFAGFESSTGVPRLMNCAIAMMDINIRGTIRCNNCFIRHYGSSSYQNSIFTNCIFNADNDGRYLHWNDIAYSCICYGIYSLQFFYEADGESNRIAGIRDISSDNRIFVNPSFFSSNDKKWIDNGFELQDSIKTKYLGNDSTEVGLYGGSFPYNPIVSTPWIKSLQLEAKPSEGILKADVEVE